ncbi:MAG: hypothetical protein L0170_19595 [Acidobacteria bacterium]|nr:hypothetical protein [Acidobacteriota bacterium]
MLVGGRWSGLSRARAHTVEYARAYFLIGLLTAMFGPIVILTLLSMIVVVPGAFCAHLLFVRIFPRKSWIREPRRSWVAAAAGVPLTLVGTLTWLNVGGEPLGAMRHLGSWGMAIYFLGIPVFFSNLGVLCGYLPPRTMPPSGQVARIPPTGGSWPP